VILCYISFVVIQLAAKRYGKYWDKRVEVFGPNKAFKSLTLNDARKEDTAPLEAGAMHVIRRNGHGNPGVRDILYVDTSKLDKTKYSRESGCRAFWYFFHCLLEDEQVQKRGLVCLTYNANFSNKNRDPTFTKMCLNTIKGALPIRMSAFHGCHPPLLYGIVSSVVMLFLGERLRKRVLAHSGSTEHVLNVLERKYSLTRDIVPTDMGGNLKLDIKRWLEERRASGL
jgi:hypothetical protein